MTQHTFLGPKPNQNIKTIIISSILMRYWPARFAQISYRVQWAPDRLLWAEHFPHELNPPRQALPRWAILFWILVLALPNAVSLCIEKGAGSCVWKYFSIWNRLKPHMNRTLGKKCGLNQLLWPHSQARRKRGGEGAFAPLIVLKFNCS